MFARQVLENLEKSSAIRAMFEEGENLRKIHGPENVYDFSLGNPDPPPPAATQQALLKLVQENPKDLHWYMSNAGYPDVRAKIADYLNQNEGTELSLAQVVMTCGAGGGLNVILKALLNPGEEVIVLAPYFVEYGFYIQNFGGKMVIVPTDSQTFQPDLSKLEEKISPKTKAIILNTPNNPSGVVYSASVLTEMAQLLEDKGREYGTTIFLISDEPYKEIVFDQVQAPSILTIFKNALVANSFSKSLSLPGERIGYVVASNRIDQINTLMEALIFANRSLGFVNAPALFQRVVAESLGSKVDVGIYQERRDLLYSHLVKLGFDCVKPDGAFYLFPKSPLPDTNAFKQLALKQRIILVPGGGFGCPDHFRLAYCVSIQTIQNSLPAFTALAQEIGLKPKS